MDKLNSYSNRYAAIIDSPLGHLGLKINSVALTGIDFLENHSPLISPTQPLATKTVTELMNYFQRHSNNFSIPLDYSAGTPFQQRVWKALLDIPAGCTYTYGELAKQVDTHPRAVGGACRTNPIPIIIPCHRIVGVNNLGGYLGNKNNHLLSGKKWLLNHEGVPHQ